MQKYFVKIDRFAAWVLLIAVIIYIISGFGMTKGIIDAQLASNLHLRWIGAVGFAAFIIHSFWAIHLALVRNQIWNVWTKILMSVVYAAAVIAVIYVAVFYQRPTEIMIIDGAGQTPSLSAYSGSNSEVTFTAAQLAKYNGLNGMPAYAAVDGKVYDLSSVYINGDHKGHKAGLDLSSAFYSFHRAEILNKFEIVGTYSGGN